MSDRSKQKSPDLETRMSLIHSAQANEPEAWNVIVNLYTPLIRHWAWVKGVRCPHELDNIKQEVFKRVFMKLNSFSKPNGAGSFRGWLRTITHHYIYSSNLDRIQLKPIGGSDWQARLNQFSRDEPKLNVLIDLISDHNVPIETGLIFRRIMDWVKNEYSPVQTSAFISTVIDQRPARDVAADLQINVNIVYQTKCRILAKIRHVFQDIV